jgi:elongation factor Ts
MNANVEAIKELREKTGAGVMDCRRALKMAAGNMDAAAAFLKEQGLQKAQKLQERTTNEGRVFVRADNRKAVVLRLGCETDFVARNEDFIRLGEECLEVAFMRPGCEEELSTRLLEVAGRTRENIVLRSLKILPANQDERIFTYVHGEGRIGVAISLTVSSPASWDHPELQKLAADLTLHVAAFGPLYLSRDAVDSRYLEHKKAEFLADAQTLGKPERMIPAIAGGKLNKHLSQICLLEQGFIREEVSSVGAVLAALRASGGPDVSVRAFVYERVGT